MEILQGLCIFCLMISIENTEFLERKIVSPIILMSADRTETERERESEGDEAGAAPGRTQQSLPRTSRTSRRRRTGTRTALDRRNDRQSHRSQFVGGLVAEINLTIN